MKEELKQYDIRNAAAFKKTTEQWGELSNMCAGFPIVVNNVSIKSVEALYQACRFPYHPDIQQKILEQNSPMTAKMVGKPHLDKTRGDWDKVRILVMKWVLRVKLAQNMERFSNILKETQDMPIVELSNKDEFWGAKPVDGDVYVGVNALGRLLMELRQQLFTHGEERFLSVAPLKINDFLLYGNPIDFVYSSQAYSEDTTQIDFFN
ncbi:Riboflavin biosynthesis intermediates N-glycosidase [Vibrio chagasii]|nr:Riboflavin biosynthesis intermediates N-glycosidase [Vibrio chagasii]